jgi:hypothetical protein
MPLPQLREPGFAHVEVELIQPVYRLGSNDLFAVDVRQQHDHRGGVLRAFRVSRIANGCWLDAPKLNERIRPLTLAVDLLQRRLVAALQRCHLRAQPRKFRVGRELGDVGSGLVYVID